MRKRLFVSLAVAGLVLSGGAIAIAQTADPAVKPAETPKTPKAERAPGTKMERADKPGRGPKGPGGPHGFGPGVERAVHGDLIVPVRPADGDANATPTFETVQFDRGKVVTATDESLTLERPDGKQVTVALNGDTKFKGVSKGSELTAGSPVFVVSKDGVARTVGQPRPGDHPKRGPRPEKAPAEPAGA